MAKKPAAKKPKKTAATGEKKVRHVFSNRIPFYASSPLLLFCMQPGLLGVLLHLQAAVPKAKKATTTPKKPKTATKAKKPTVKKSATKAKKPAAPKVKKTTATKAKKPAAPKSATKKAASKKKSSPKKKAAAPKAAKKA